MPGLFVVTAPVSEPVTLADAMSHARVDSDEDQGFIQRCVKAAREWLEEITGRQFITATLRLDLDEFPACGYIDLPRPPLGSVTSVTYYDSSNVQQTLSASTAYESDPSPSLPRVRLRTGQWWPSTYDRANAVSVTYTAGYGAAPANVPAPIQMAILQLVAHWYQNRETTVVGTISKELEFQTKRLIQPYRMELIPA